MRIVISESQLKKLILTEQVQLDESNAIQQELARLFGKFFFGIEKAIVLAGKSYTKNEVSVIISKIGKGILQKDEKELLRTLTKAAIAADNKIIKNISTHIFEEMEKIGDKNLRTNYTIQIKEKLSEVLAPEILKQVLDNVGQLLDNKDLNTTIGVFVKKYIEKNGQKSFDDLNSLYNKGKINSEQFKGLLNVGSGKISTKELPKHFYHGTTSKISFDELDPFYRKEAYKNFDPLRHTSGSGHADNVGIYFTDNINQANPKLPDSYLSPSAIYNRDVIFKDYTQKSNFESASKWASLYDKDGYIYEITLKPDAIVVKDGTLDSHVQSIKTGMFNKLNSYNVDAVWNGGELCILNKNAIQSYRPIFKFDYRTTKWIKM